MALIERIKDEIEDRKKGVKYHKEMIKLEEVMLEDLEKRLKFLKG